MGNQTTNLVARLQLRAEQFDSEVGQRFANLATRAKSAASETRDAFAGAFAETQKLAQQAFQMPRSTGSGSLDLSAEIASLNEAATKADNHAQALRELSIAQSAAAASGRVDAEAMKLEADAAAVGAIAAEREAQAHRDRIAALGVVQAELNRSVSATNLHNTALERAGVSAGQQRQSMIQLGQQFGDFTVQVTSGQSVATAFAQQIGQAAFAVQGMGGKMAGVAAFLGGPWGIAATIATVALAPFVGKLFDTDEAAKKALDGLREFEKKELDFPDLLDKTTGRLKDQTEALRELGRVAAQVLPSRIADATETAKEKRNDAFIAAREYARQQLISGNRDGTLEGGIQRSGGSAIALNEVVQKLAPFRSDPAFAAMARTVADATAAQVLAIKEVRQLQGQLYTARTVNSGGAILTPESIRRSVQDGLASTAVERAQSRVRGADDELTRLGTLPVSAEQQSALARAKANYEAAESALKAAQEAARHKDKVVSLGDQVETAQAAALFKDAASFRGAREGDSVLGDLFKQANVHVDPKITAWCAAFVNAVLATNGLPQTNSLAARSFLGYGTATDKPQVGDIVVAKRGSDPSQGHVGFYQGTDAKGNVQVLGGNTADKVGTMTVAKTDILGFRRAPTAAEQYKVDEKGIKAAETDAEKLARFLGSSDEAIARISTGFGVAETTVRRATLATQALDAEIADLSKRKVGVTDPADLDAINKRIAAAQAAKVVVAGSLDRPVRDFIDGQRQAYEIGQLVLGGQEDQAEALRTINQLERDRGPLSEAQKAAILATTQALRAQGEEIERNRQRQQAMLGVVDDVRRSITDTIFDPGSLGELPGKITDAFRKAGAELITENLFGDTFRKLKNDITGQTEVTNASARMASAVDEVAAKTRETSAALDQLGSAARGAAGGVGGAPTAASSWYAGPGASPPNSPSVIGGVAQLLTSPADAELSLLPVNAVKDLVDSNREITAAVNGLGSKIPKALEDAMKGAAFGQRGGGIFSTITGKKADGTASAIGGVLGQEAGKAIGKLVPQAATGLLKTLGGAAGPIGAVVGGVLGNLLGGLFHNPKFGTTVINNTTTKPTASAGNSDAARAGAVSAGGAVQQGLEQIADALDGMVGDFKVSLGTFDGKWRVSGTGFSGSLNSNDARNQDLHNFGTDGRDEALAYAISDAIMDGAIQGISEASQRVLAKATSDGLQKQLEKALLIEAIPRDLKAMLDPVGAAVDDLNRKWEKTVAALNEGGASAEQMAQAQQLYKLQLDQIKGSTDSASAGLKSFISSLTIGSASPLALRDQEAAARAQLQPFLDTIAAGGRVDQGKYQTAAQSYLDVERELYGSTEKFFEAFDAVQASTAKAIAAIDNAVPISGAVADPFAEQTATNTATANDLLVQVGSTLVNMQQLLAQIAAAGGGGGSGFIGQSRSF